MVPGNVCFKNNKTIPLAAECVSWLNAIVFCKYTCNTVPGTCRLENFFSLVSEIFLNLLQFVV